MYPGQACVVLDEPELFPDTGRAVFGFPTAYHAVVIVKDTVDLMTGNFLVAFHAHTRLLVNESFIEQHALLHTANRVVKSVMAVDTVTCWTRCAWGTLGIYAIHPFRVVPMSRISMKVKCNGHVPTAQDPKEHYHNDENGHGQVLYSGLGNLHCLLP
jgi:hypothetical protein